MTVKYNAREKRKRKKAKLDRQKERVKELIAKAAKNKPAKREHQEKPAEENQG